MADARWYYTRDGHQIGPLSGSDLKQLAAGGKLLPDDLVWKEGAADWKPARQVRGLFAQSVAEMSLDETAYERWAKLGATGAEKLERYSEFSSGGIWESILDQGRQRITPDLLDSISKVLAKWGTYALFLAMFLFPAYLVILGFRENETAMFAVAVGVFVLLAVAQYVARRMIDTVLLLVEGTPSRIAGTAFLDILAHLFVLTAAAPLGIWVFDAILGQADFIELIVFVAASIESFYRASLCLHPRMINVITSEPTSLGEEAVGVVSALLKVLLRAVPVTFGVICIVGSAGLVVALLLSFLGSEWQGRSSEYAKYSGAMIAVAAVIPLLMYLFGIFFYVILDVIRSILMLPGKIDRLADAHAMAPQGGDDGQ